MNVRESALLNKIYRAVHDGVCPSCGADYSVNHDCPCGFIATDDDMRAMRSVIREWGKEAVTYFNKWRRNGETS